MNLHPYDNVERRFHHTDPDQRQGLAVVARVLGLAAPPCVPLLYDMSFYSGGMGIFDRLAITAQVAGPGLWAEVIASLVARTPEDLAGDAAWGEEFLWLVEDEDEPRSPRDAAVAFINTERRPFQAPCLATNRILFAETSGVNDWQAIWGDDEHLHFLGFSQG